MYIVLFFFFFFGFLFELSEAMNDSFFFGSLFPPSYIGFVIALLPFFLIWLLLFLLEVFFGCLVTYDCHLMF